MEKNIEKIAEGSVNPAPVPFTINSSLKCFDVNIEKIRTLEDLKLLFSHLNINVSLDLNDPKQNLTMKLLKQKGIIK